MVKFHAALLVFTVIAALNSSSIQQTTTNHNANQDPLTRQRYLEQHLSAKANDVVQGITDSSFTIDLSVELEDGRTTYTDLVSGQYESRTDYTPTVRSIRCCVTIEARDPKLDTDHLYRRLAYALGLDLARGDLLKLVTR